MNNAQVCPFCGGTGYEQDEDLYEITPHCLPCDGTGCIESNSKYLKELDNYLYQKEIEYSEWEAKYSGPEWDEPEYDEDDEDDDEDDDE